MKYPRFWLTVLAVPLALALRGAEAAARSELFDAVRANDLAKVTALLEQGGNPNERNKSQLTPLCTVASVEVARALIAKGADVNYQETQYLTTPLLNAIHCRREAVVRFLIDHGAKVNVRNGEGNGPLYVAIHQKLPVMVARLVAQGADVTVANKYGYTPLSEACRRGDETVIKLLLSQGADPASEDAKGMTPLHEAARGGFDGAVTLLLDARVDVNAQDNDSRTPLHWATTNGHVSTVKLLLRRGADPSLQDSDKHTPLDLAEFAAFFDPKSELLEVLCQAVPPKQL